MSRIETIDECAMVDELASLKAAIAPLQAREETIKDYFKAAGKERYIGTEHEAVIVLSEKHSPDVERLKIKLKVTDLQWKAQWCKKSDSVACRLTARKTH